MNSATTFLRSRAATSVPDWENKNHFRTRMMQTLKRFKEILAWATLSKERIRIMPLEFRG
jgi:hypothetical protein